MRDLNFHVVSSQFQNFTRMSQEDFEYLVLLPTPEIAKTEYSFQGTNSSDTNFI